MAGLRGVGGHQAATRRPAASNHSGAVELDATALPGSSSPAAGAALISSAALSAERDVHVVLVAEMLDASHRARAACAAVAPLAQAQVLGARRRRVAAPAGAGQAQSAARGSRLIARRAEARARRSWSDRVLVDLARRADLHQPAVVEHADAVAMVIASIWSWVT